MGRYMRTRNERNLRKDNLTGDWVVYKIFNQLPEPVIYKRFKTFREARQYRNMLDKKDAWKTDLPLPIKRKLLNRKGKNYVKVGNFYKIIHTKNGIRGFYGLYNTEKDAQKVVKALKDNNWKWDELPEDLKKLKVIRKGKFYYTDGDGFKVKKTINGKNINLGKFKTEEDAQKIVKWCEENNWDYTNLPKELEDLKIKPKDIKYHSFTQGKYTVNKFINGKTVHFGRYDDLETAEKIIKGLEECNWQPEKLPDDLKKIYSKRIPKYYRYDKAWKKYVVARSLKGKHRYYGAYDTEKEAKDRVEYLKKHNWDISLSIQRNTGKHYSKAHGRYVINKRINGKQTYFGEYATEKEAQEMVKLLEKNNWDKSIIKKYNPSNYTKLKNSWRVSKHINGKIKYFGQYPTEETAQQVVAVLKENNWDYNSLPQELKDMKITKNKPSYYIHTNGRYYIRKNENGKPVYHGCYTDLETVEKVIAGLEKCNWNPDKLPDDLKKLYSKKPKKYYVYDKNICKYIVKKTINKKVYCYGSYETEDEARLIVELLKENNWNKECLV